ncbi:MAG TPA: histidine kinase [Blastocatellia bacterium]|nr:histidine kinase [Blastocatellia bacterium]
MKLSRKIINFFRTGDLGFIAVVVVSYASAIATAGYAPRAFTPVRLVLLIAAGLAYVIFGTYWFARCRRTGKLLWSAAYFAAQLLVSATIIYLLPSGAIFLITLPLAGQSVVLLSSRWAVLVVCLGIFLMMVAPIWWRGGVAPALIVGMIFLAGIVFVVVFTRIAVNERQARAEVERLAAEVGEANRKLREYAAQVDELATVRERNRLAREIHDSLGHYLTVVNVQIEAARAVIDDRERSLDVLRKAQALTQDGLTEVRRSVAALRSTAAEHRPLPELLQLLVSECQSAGIDARLTVEGVPRELSSQVELTMYRAAQEGLTNVRKHAHATSVAITLDYVKADAIRLLIKDDGIGGGDGAGGFGLLGVRERALLLGGEVRIHTSDEGGFALEVCVPT